MSWPPLIGDQLYLQSYLELTSRSHLSLTLDVHFFPINNSSATVQGNKGRIRTGEHPTQTSEYGECRNLTF